MPGAVHTERSNVRRNLRAQLINGVLSGTRWPTCQPQQQRGQAATLSWLLKSWPKFIDAHDETEATRRKIKSMLADMIRTGRTPKASKSAALEGRLLYAEELELLEARHLDIQRQPCPPAEKEAAHQAPSGGRKKKLAWEDEVKAAEAKRAEEAKAEEAEDALAERMEKKMETPPRKRPRSEAESEEKHLELSGELEDEEDAESEDEGPPAANWEKQGTDSTDASADVSGCYRSEPMITLA